MKGAKQGQNSIVEKAKGVLDKGKGLDLKMLKNLAETLTEAEIYQDIINYIIKHKFEGNIQLEQIEKHLHELLLKLEILTGELSEQPSRNKKDERPENQSSGHEKKDVMPLGNARRCIVYLSHFPKGYVFNCTRITRLFVAHEFFPADSGEPLQHQLANWLEAAESIWDGDRAPSHFLVGNDVREQTLTWPENHHLVREKVAESRESNVDEIFHSSLIFLGGTNHTLKLKEVQFFLLKILSLRNGKLENEISLKTLSFLKYLDLKYSNVRDCSWLMGLEELQMLDLRYTGVEEIPEKCLEKLGKLQHLLLGYRPKKGDNRLAGVKLNTQKLMTTNLKTLRAIRSPKVIENYGSVSNIIDLSVMGLKTEQLKPFWVAVENFENLTRLGVSVTKDSAITLQDCPDKLKKKLKRLRMEGKFSVKPHSGLHELCDFWSLIDLTLASHKPININSIPPLPALLCLRLYGVCNEKSLTFGGQGFHSLKKLVIGDMERVKTIQLASAVIETVATLKLCNLPQFKELVCLDTQLPLLRCSFESKMNVRFKEVQSHKSIFLRGFNNICLQKSPHLKIYHYDMNKQCYKEVN